MSLKVITILSLGREYYSIKCHIPGRTQATANTWKSPSLLNNFLFGQWQLWMSLWIKIKCLVQLTKTIWLMSTLFSLTLYTSPSLFQTIFMTPSFLPSALHSLGFLYSLPNSSPITSMMSSCPALFGLNVASFRKVFPEPRECQCPWLPLSLEGGTTSVLLIAESWVANWVSGPQIPTEWVSKWKNGWESGKWNQKAMALTFLSDSAKIKWMAKWRKLFYELDMIFSSQHFIF